MDWNSLIDKMASGSIPALSRLITLVENRAPGWQEAMKRIFPVARNAATIGITGHPGSGKSTLTGQLVRELVARGKRVGVIAIDPSSHLSGGAFLGDRVRMNAVSALEGVYIRSMGSRGAVGGLHQAARDVIKILDAHGKDYILVETVGVGQDEIDIAKATQIVLLVCAPGQGDAIQYLKAGVMEIADIYVANKTDLPEAELMINNLRALLFCGEAESQATVSMFKTCAATGVGISPLMDEIEKRIGAPQRWNARRRELAIEEVTSLLRERITSLVTSGWASDPALIGALDALLDYRTDPYSLAEDILFNAFPKMLKKSAS